MGGKHSKQKSNMYGGSEENGTINWNNLNTEDFSSDIPYLAKMNKDVDNLVSNLKLPETNTSTQNHDVDSVFERIYNKVGDTSSVSNFNTDTALSKTELTDSLDETSAVEYTENDYSNTSPFISPDMYKDMMEKSSSVENNILQSGGADETSSTILSTIKSISPDPNAGTSMDSSEMQMSEGSETSVEQPDSLPQPEPSLMPESSEIIESSDQQNNNSTVDETINQILSVASESDNQETDKNQTGGYYPINDNGYYLSSSAHTNTESSVVESTISMNNNKLLSDEIRTSDINMVSVE